MLMNPWPKLLTFDRRPLRRVAAKPDRQGVLRAEFLERATLSIIIAAGMILALAVFWPGVMTYDASYVYADIGVERPGDWQSPVMSLVWGLIDPIAPGSRSIFLLMVTLYWLSFAILAFSLLRRSKLLAFLLVTLAVSPPAFLLLGVIWRDVLLAQSWLLAAALAFATVEARGKAKIAAQSLAALLALFGLLLRPNALFAAPILFCYVLWPSAFQWRRVVVAYIPFLLLGFALAQFIYYGILNAQHQNLLHTILVFDLGGITHFSGRNWFPVEWPEDQLQLLLNGCYDPSQWDTYWRLSPCPFVMTDLGNKDIFGSWAMVEAWLNAIYHNPLQYAQHRMAHMWSFMTEAHSTVAFHSLTNPSEPMFPDNYLFNLLARLDAAINQSIFFRLGFWFSFAGALCFLGWRQRKGPGGAFVIATTLSALFYMGTFLFVGVASAYRYGYWSVLASISAAVVLLSTFVPSRTLQRVEAPSRRSSAPNLPLPASGLTTTGLRSRQPTMISCSKVALTLAAMLTIASTHHTHAIEAGSPVPSEQEGPFSRELLLAKARVLSQSSYVAPSKILPPKLAALEYARYQGIRYNSDRTIWFGRGDYGLQLFHRGFLFKDKVDVSVITGGAARRLIYDKGMFALGDLADQISSDIGFAGIRLVKRSGPGLKIDEYAVFLGASYFRAIAAGQAYGLSARGLAIGSGLGPPEEFPAFRKFWIDEDSSDSEALLIYALLDSPSVAGGYVFRVKYADVTRIEVEATLFPRIPLTEVGIAAGTSMFQFDGNSRRRADDYRPQVHDSDGLLIQNGRGERLWRPLANPKSIQISDFVDVNPSGFGLMQRQRDLAAYQDRWARYHLRPSLWIVPANDWGAGAVRLVEIPTDTEFFDNIVAYWRPRNPLQRGTQHTFKYLLEWGNGPSLAGCLCVAATRQGRVAGSQRSDLRQFVIDYRSDRDASLSDTAAPPEARVKSSKGEIRSPLVFRYGDGWRLMFQLDPKGEASIDIRAELLSSGPREVWVFRWTPS